MRSVNIIAGLLCLALFANNVNARKDPGENWKGMKKDQRMQEISQENDFKPTYKESLARRDFDGINPKASVRDFEPRPSATSYVGDQKPGEGKYFMKDFEPRPNLSAYTDDVKPTDEKSYMKDFEPRPNVSAYNDDAVGKDFENQPNGCVKVD